MNMGTKGWVSIASPARQGKSRVDFTSLGQVFAFTSPGGFQVAWSQLLLMHGHCPGQAMLHSERGEVSGHLWEHLQSSQATLIFQGVIFSHTGSLDVQEVILFLEQREWFCKPNDYHPVTTTLQSPPEIKKNNCVSWAQLLR